MEFDVLLIATAMVYTASGVLKHARAGQWYDVLTIGVVFAVAVGVAFLLRSSDFAGGFEVGGKALADLNGASTVLVGYAIASASRLLHQVVKAVDTTQSAAEPKLIPPAVTEG